MKKASNNRILSLAMLLHKTHGNNK